MRYLQAEKTARLQTITFPWEAGIYVCVWGGGGKQHHFHSIPSAIQLQFCSNSKASVRLQKCDMEQLIPWRSPMTVSHLVGSDALPWNAHRAALASLTSSRWSPSTGEAHELPLIEVAQSEAEDIVQLQDVVEPSAGIEAN